MKKVYIMATFLGATTFAFNQVQKLPAHFSKNTDKVISSNVFTQKAPGQLIWSSDFSNPSEWVIGGDGQQGAWQIGTVNNLQYNNYYYDITSTTVNNGFAFFEGIGYLLNGPVLQQNAWIEMANSVNLTGETTISFKFEQAYRAFNHDETYVEVSLDGGTTWEQANDINAGITANNYSNESVVVRNFNVNSSSNVKFRFRWSSMTADDQFGAGYAWQVDDVEIQRLSDNDIKTSDLVYGSAVANNLDDLFYYQIPFSQVAPINGTVTMTNQGTQNQTNVTYNGFETLFGNYSGSSTPVNINVGAQNTSSLNTPFTPSAKGTYKLEYGITADQVDDVPSNNALQSYIFRVGDYLYARDRSTIAETHRIQGGSYTMNDDVDPSQSSAMEIGNIYHIFNSQEVTGIDFKFGRLVSEGSLIYGHILDSTLTQVSNGETIAYTVQANDTGKYVTLKFNTPLNLAPGEYVATVTCFEPEFSVATSGTSAPQTSFVYEEASDTWYYTTSTPIVRMNFSPNLNCAENPAFNYGNIGNTCVAAGGGSVTPNQVVTPGGTFSFASAPSDGATINASTGVISNTTPGTSYSVKYVTPSGNCEETKTITVNEFPSVSAVATPASSCEGAPVTLQASGATNYFWGLDLGNGDNKTVIPANTTTYTVIGYNGFCRDTASLQVSVSQYDDASFFLSNFCAATTTNNIPSNVVTPGGIFVFNPPVSDGATIDPSTGEITGGVSGSSYTVEYTTSGDCPSTTSLTINVTDEDDATFTFADACVGTALTPTNIATLGGTFSFDTPPSDGATIDPTTGTISNATGGTSYDVAYETQAGACQGTSVVTVAVFSLPTIDLTVSDSEICENETAQLQASGAVTYSWDNGATGATQDVSPSSTTSYAVTGTDANGCSASNETVITVNSLPVITFENVTACDSVSQVGLTASPAGGTFSGAGVTGNNLSVSGVGSYEVTYTYADGNGCENTATATVTVEECLSIAENELTSFVIAPNPASNYFEVRVEGNNKINNVQLVSLQGQVVPAKFSTVSTQATLVDISKVANGTYFIQLTTDRGQLTKKVVIQ